MGRIKKTDLYRTKQLQLKLLHCADDIICCGFEDQSCTDIIMYIIYKDRSQILIIGGMLAIIYGVIILCMAPQLGGFLLIGVGVILLGLEVWAEKNERLQDSIREQEKELTKRVATSLRFLDSCPKIHSPTRQLFDAATVPRPLLNFALRACSIAPTLT